MTHLFVKVIIMSQLVFLAMTAIKYLMLVGKLFQVLKTRYFQKDSVFYS